MNVEQEREATAYQSGYRAGHFRTRRDESAASEERRRYAYLNRAAWDDGYRDGYKGEPSKHGACNANGLGAS